jgi:Na+/phosphate symporter
MPAWDSFFPGLNKNTLETIRFRLTHRSLWVYCIYDEMNLLDLYHGLVTPLRTVTRLEESGTPHGPRSELPGGLDERARQEIRSMCEESVEMLRLTARAFATQSTATLQTAANLGRDIHQREKALTEMMITRLTGEERAAEAHKELLFVPMHLERVGDNIEFLVRAVNMMIKEGIPFTERALSEVNSLFDKDVEILECVRDAVNTKNKVLLRHIVDEGKRFDSRVDEFALLHQQRMIEGVCVPKASSLYVAILDYLKGIESHCRQIGLKLMEQKRL